MTTVSELIQLSREINSLRNSYKESKTWSNKQIIIYNGKKKKATLEKLVEKYKIALLKSAKDDEFLKNIIETIV